MRKPTFENGVTADQSASRAVEYLYSWSPWVSEFGGETRHSFKRYPIIKRTAKRVFYWRAGEDIDERGEPIVYAHVADWPDKGIGFVDRQKLETEGFVRNNGRHWSAADSPLYASLEDILAQRRGYDRLREVAP
jgi:hypothetical protein